MAGDHVGDQTIPLNRRTGEDTILAELASFREDVTRQMDGQNAHIAQIRVTQTDTAEKVEKMEKVLSGPMKLVKATEGAITFAQMLGAVAVWVTKVGLALALLWAVWKFAIGEAFKSLPK